MTQPPPSMVDWDLAVRIGARIAGDGPTVTRAEADAAVEELRAGADRSTALVREFTGLAAGERTAPVLVVDRTGWVQANADAFAMLLGPIIDKLNAKKPPSGLSTAIGSRVTGAEVGGLLGFLGGKVLGQFDPFYDPAGRLLLVAPNIVHVERELGADPTDFRLWVCLHEETHRVQFTAVPWMRDHLFAEISKLADTMEPSSLVDDGFGRIVEAIKGAKDGAGSGGGGSLLDAISTPEQKELHRPDDRRDVAARGPRRRRDGRRRARVSSRRSPGSEASSTSAARASGPSTGSCAGCSASTPRWRSTATARCSSGTSSTRPGWSSSTRSGSEPRTCRPRPRSPTRRPG